MQQMEHSTQPQCVAAIQDYSQNNVPCMRSTSLGSESQACAPGDSYWDMHHTITSQEAGGTP